MVCLEKGIFQYAQWVIESYCNSIKIQWEFSMVFDGISCPKSPSSFLLFSEIKTPDMCSTMLLQKAKSVLDII